MQNEHGPFLITLRVAGAVILDAWIPLMCENLGLDRSDVDCFTVELHDDMSGVDRDRYHVRLKSGAKVIPDSDPVLLSAAMVVPELRGEYVVVGWQTHGDPLCSDSTRLEDHEFDVLFGRDPATFGTETEILSYLDSLLGYRGTIEGAWRGRSSVGSLIVRRLIHLGRFTWLEERLGEGFPHSARNAAQFQFAATIVEEIACRHLGDAYRLVSSLLGSGSPLNEHWKSRLNEVLLRRR